MVAERVEAGLAVIGAHPAVADPAERGTVDPTVQHEIVPGDSAATGALNVSAKLRRIAKPGAPDARCMSTVLGEGCFGSVEVAGTVSAPDAEVSTD